jgi:hypothetical protein
MWPRSWPEGTPREIGNDVPNTTDAAIEVRAFMKSKILERYTHHECLATTFIWSLKEYLIDVFFLLVLQEIIRRLPARPHIRIDNRKLFD